MGQMLGIPALPLSNAGTPGTGVIVNSESFPHVRVQLMQANSAVCRAYCVGDAPRSIPPSLAPLFANTDVTQL